MNETADAGPAPSRNGQRLVELIFTGGDEHEEREVDEDEGDGAGVGRRDEGGLATTV
jgi:hypothetical protein